MTQPLDVPPPEPANLLNIWMAWERGDVAPGQTLADLKKGGLRQLLESTVSAHEEVFGAES